MHTPGRLYSRATHLDAPTDRPPASKPEQACPSCGAPMVFETRDEKVARGAFAADVAIETWWCDRCGEAILEGRHVAALDTQVAKLDRLARSRAALGIALAWSSVTPSTDSGWDALLERTASGWRWVLSAERWQAFAPADDPGLRALLAGKPPAVASLELRRNAQLRAKLHRERMHRRARWEERLPVMLLGCGWIARMIGAYKLGRAQGKGPA